MGAKPGSGPPAPTGPAAAAAVYQQQGALQALERSIHWVAWSMYCFDAEWTLIGKYTLQLSQGTSPALHFFPLEQLRVNDKILDLIMQSSESDFHAQRGLTRSPDESFDEYRKRVFWFAYFQKQPYAVAHSRWNEAHPLSQYC